MALGRVGLAAEAVHALAPGGWAAVGMGLAVAAVLLSGLSTYLKGVNALRRGRLNISALMAVAVTGALLIETLFSLDGLGLLSYESVIRRDYPVVLGTLYLFTLIGLITKLISDLTYVWVDPRVKFD